MAHEKQYTPKQVTIAILGKVEELLKKSELTKAKDDAKMVQCNKCGDMYKAESKHDRCVEHVKQVSPGVNNPHAVCVAEGVKPESWNKSEGEYKPENEQKPNAQPSEHNSQDASQPAQGKAPAGEIKPKEQEQAPSDNVRPTEGTVPHNGNPQWGDDPQVRGHFKLAKFIGHMESKRKRKVVI